MIQSNTQITLTGHLLLPDGDRSVRLAPGTITVAQGRITSVREGPLDQHPDFGGEACLICPGFVDTHLHLPQFDSIGIDGLELLDWLDRIIFPAEARWADTDFAGHMAGRVARQLLSFGTTAVAAYATVHHQSAQAAIDALAGAGLAGHVGQVLMDQEAPSDLIRPARQLLAEAPRLEARGRIRPSITPRFAVSCSRELLHGAGTLANSTGWLVQTHLSETQREIEFVRSLHPEPTYVDVYAAAKLLTPRTLLAHGIWLDGKDLGTIALSGSTIAHCPTANRFLAAGEMDRAKAIAAGVRVSAGTDVAGGPDRSMVRVARAMIDTAKQVHASPPSAADCWWQITAGNADALGLADVGRIHPGAAADLLVVGPDIPWQGGLNPLSTLMYGWDDRWLKQTLLAGRAACPS